MSSFFLYSPTLSSLAGLCREVGLSYKRKIYYKRRNRLGQIVYVGIVGIRNKLQVRSFPDAFSIQHLYPSLK